MGLSILSVAYPLAPTGPGAVGGAEQILTTLEAELVRRGHRSVVVACAGSHVAGELAPVPLPAGPFDEAACATVRRQVRQQVQRLLAAQPFDLVHFHGVDFPEYLPDTAVPLLATLHLPVDHYPAWLWQRTPPNLRLHCVSQSQHATAPVSGALLRPVPNGVDLQRLRPAGRKRNWCLALGRICPEKRLHWALLAAREAGVPLLLGGQVFPYAAHEQYFAREIVPLLDRERRFLGPLPAERKRRLLASASCLVIASEVAETSSLVAMEALACGTPVAATRAGALPEVIRDGVTGFLADTPSTLATAIRRCGTLLPAVCRREAETRFAAQRMVDEYLRCYRELLASVPAAKPIYG